MLSTLSELRWLNRLSFRTVLAGNFCRKNINTETKVLFNRNFIGYVEPHSVKFQNNRHYERFFKTRRPYSSQTDSNDSSQGELDALQFDKISGETLDSLMEYFDELVEHAEHLQDADVSYGDGVLTIKFGDDYGTYVINRQTPNKQIWLSSPKSGPKRYDFTIDRWIYKHDGKSLHQLLDDEIPTLVKSDTAFDKCSYGGTGKMHKNS